ncbi:hypothetical protein Lfu02_15320 [Longispora fulva]|uniref:Transcriptional regulator with XRE-family HTH domain n=1 Tax=Longispora fulva TaxID=619741 RepID=A0A8J7H2F4_9ACTN|nr:helix-turn-helix transcriptional regulator [Longispora fulva]MBG6140458.1 transcriptional regulator with XRE-family HTH domain [Longispora fulva]GIG57160.1 hypothetical protein Lfu02_15320 [Longispora fulva]
MTGDTFGEALRARRAAQGLTQRALAKLAFIAASRVNEYEGKGLRPTIDNAKALDDALGAGGELLTLAERMHEDRRLRVVSTVPFNVYSYAALSQTLLTGNGGEGSPVDRRQVLALGGAVAGFGALAPGLGMETARHSLNLALAEDRARAGTDEWHEIIRDYGYDYFSQAPADLLDSLWIDNFGIQVAAQNAGSDTERNELRRVAATLAALIAMTMANLANLTESRRWWRTARTLAEASGNVDTELWVRGRQIIRALYEQRPVDAIIRLADESMALASHGSPQAVTELTSGRAQALALAGRHDEALSALATAESLMHTLPADAVDESPDRESVLIWRENRYRFTASYVYSHLGMLAEAGEAQDQALRTYSRTYHRGPAQIELQRALCMVRAGDAAGGAKHAQTVLNNLPRRDHIRPVVDLGYSVLHAAPRETRSVGAVADLDHYLNVHAAITA